MKNLIAGTLLIAIQTACLDPILAGNQICAAIVTFDDVLASNPSNHGFLEKMNVELRIRELNVSDSVKQQIRKFRPFSVQMHVLRILRNGGSEAERNFGIAMLNQYEKIENSFHAGGKTREWSIAADCIGTETENTPIWWTFGPYLFKYLRQYGFSENDAVVRLVDWAAAGNLRFGEDSERITLPGMDFLNERRYSWRRTYVLDLDDNQHVTHRYTDQEASRLVREFPFFQ